VRHYIQFYTYRGTAFLFYNDDEYIYWTKISFGRRMKYCHREPVELLAASCCDMARPCHEYRYMSIYSVSTLLSTVKCDINLPTVPIDS